jgi:hypothetical protein
VQGRGIFWQSPSQSLWTFPHPLRNVTHNRRSQTLNV